MDLLYFLQAESLPAKVPLSTCAAFGEPKAHCFWITDVFGLSALHKPSTLWQLTWSYLPEGKMVLQPNWAFYPPKIHPWSCSNWAVPCFPTGLHWCSFGLQPRLYLSLLSPVHFPDCAPCCMWVWCYSSNHLVFLLWGGALWVRFFEYTSQQQCGCPGGFDPCPGWQHIFKRFKTNHKIQHTTFRCLKAVCLKRGFFSSA